MSMRRWFSVMLVTAVFLCTASFLCAQETAPKVEVFGGYSWYHPGGTVVGATVPDFNKGWGAQFTYNVNNWVGLAVDGNGHYNDNFGDAHSLMFGPQFKLRTEHFVPFAEALLGVQFFSPNHFPNQDAAAYAFGGGIDYPITRRFSVRAVQVDYVGSYYDKVSLPGEDNTFKGVRLQAGVLFNFGVPAAEGPVSLACSIAPQAVDAGVPVKVTVTPTGFLPKRTLSYSYASNGGKIAANAPSASVDTTGVAPGSYTVNAKVVDNGKGKHQQTASCTATFAINQPHPPVLSVSANPTSLKPGDTSTITATGSSPDNRPLSYSCTSTAGRLTGNGPIYTLETSGVPEGTITVNCTVSDDRNLTATASTAVTVSAPPPPPPPTAKDFGSIDFKRDLKRPTRVDNEAKGELDRYADALAAAPDAKGVVVGYATAREDTPKKGSKKSPDFAARRAVNTKDYVTKEKGIDPARIEPRTGTGDDQKTELWIVPAGATFPAEGTTVVDEAKVKPVPRAAVHPMAAHHKRAHKKADR